MSTISNALNNWLQRHYNVSMMRQPLLPVRVREVTPCDDILPETRTQMIDISQRSADKRREMGAAITHDYTLGMVMTGTRESVIFPRPPETIGSYHTHPFGHPFPSILDALDAMDKDDKIVCIGATGKPGTKIVCFTPNKPKWLELQMEYTKLRKDISQFNIETGGRYGRRGHRLRDLLESIRLPEYVKIVQTKSPEQAVLDAESADRYAENRESDALVAIHQAKQAELELKTAEVELESARTEMEIREAQARIRRQKDEARRANQKIQVEHELAAKARVAADKARFEAEALARGVAQATAEHDMAIKVMDAGAELRQRRSALEEITRNQVREIVYPKTWKAPKWVNGFKEAPFFEVYPNIFNKCRLVWEELEEKLPWEL